MRFTAEEAAALLGEAAGPGLPGTAVAALVARTEGWAAGLQLAGLSLRARGSGRVRGRPVTGHQLKRLCLAAVGCQAELPFLTIRSVLAGDASRSRGKREPPI